MAKDSKTLESSKDNKSMDSNEISNIADCKHSKLSQQDENKLIEGLGNVWITKTGTISMMDIADLCMVCGKDSNYLSPKSEKRLESLHPRRIQKMAGSHSKRDQLHDQTGSVGKDQENHHSKQSSNDQKKMGV